jgi:hypothetical protein
LSVLDKQTNNGHKKGEGQTDKQWTQEKGRTNRLTMNTRKGKNKQTNNEHKKREGKTDYGHKKGEEQTDKQ